MFDRVELDDNTKREMALITRERAIDNFFALLRMARIPFETFAVDLSKLANERLNANDEQS